MRTRVGSVIIAVGLLLGALSHPVTVHAASIWADEATYRQQAIGKLKFGVTNALLGWTSLFREPMKANQAGENVFVGIGRGVWDAVGQTVGGAAHAVTFPLTMIDIPLPEGGTDILQ